MRFPIKKTDLALSGMVLLGLWLGSSVGAQMLPLPVIPEMPAASAGILPAPGAKDGPESGAFSADGALEIPDVARQRDPFWPVGYVPRKRVVKAPAGAGGAPKGASAVEATPEPVRMPAWDEARKQLDIRGISLIHEKHSRTPKYLAMVGGKLVEEGNVVAVKYDDRVYRWRVVGIATEGVSLQKLDVRGE